VRQSHLFHLILNRPAAEVYAFLAKPQNYAEWAAVTGRMVQIGPQDWRVDTAFGERIIRFCELNSFGVLDHAVYRAGEEPMMLPMRVVPNGEGSELMFLFFRRPDMSDEQFASSIEWINVDFLTLRSLIET
jgi:hypothetical protein